MNSSRHRNYKNENNEPKKLLAELVNLKYS